METLIFVWTIVKAVLGISFVIFWHELGHFLLAKWNGVYVKTFSIGFPPRLLRLFRYKETDYVVGSIPLGGYVHMLGEDEGQVAPGPDTPSETDADGEPRAGIDPRDRQSPGGLLQQVGLGPDGDHLRRRGDERAAGVPLLRRRLHRRRQDGDPGQCRRGQPRGARLPRRDARRR